MPILCLLQNKSLASTATFQQTTSYVFPPIYLDKARKLSFFPRYRLPDIRTARDKDHLPAPHAP